MSIVVPNKLILPTKERERVRIKFARERERIELARER
jgi:hypothetical protein